MNKISEIARVLDGKRESIYAVNLILHHHSYFPSRQMIFMPSIDKNCLFAKQMIFLALFASLIHLCAHLGVFENV